MLRLFPKSYHELNLLMLWFSKNRAIMTRVKKKVLDKRP